MACDCLEWRFCWKCVLPGAVWHVVFNGSAFVLACVCFVTLWGTAELVPMVFHIWICVTLVSGISMGKPQEFEFEIPTTHLPFGMAYILSKGYYG